MRIAYLINQYPKVSHTFIRREILALEELGIDVERISIRGWDTELVDPEDLRERDKTRFVLKGGLSALLSSLFAVAVSSPLGFFRAFRLSCRLGFAAERPLAIHWAYLAEACQVIRWLRSTNVDHMHAHFGTNSAEVAMLANALGGPTWSFTVHGPKEFEKVHAIRLPEKVRGASFTVAISSFGRSQLYRTVDHTHWSKIHVVHCGLDAEFLGDAATPVPDTTTLVCVGRLCEQKGQLILVDAVRRLIAEGRKLRLVLAGDGEMRPEIEAYIERYRLRKHIEITGWLTAKEVKAHIVASRAMVLPSFAEGLPVVVMEAMALGRPVISTYVAGIPELVLPGRHGWLVPAGDPLSLATAISECLQTPIAALSRMGAAGRERVLTRHNARLEAARLAALFSDVMAASQRVGCPKRAVVDQAGH